MAVARLGDHWCVVHEGNHTHEDMMAGLDAAREKANQERFNELVSSYAEKMRARRKRRDPLFTAWLAGIACGAGAVIVLQLLHILRWP